jgi:hypothetical protein
MIRNSEIQPSGIETVNAGSLTSYRGPAFAIVVAAADLSRGAQRSSARTPYAVRVEPDTYVFNNLTFPHKTTARF